MFPRHPSSTLFPYTTLFRSLQDDPDEIPNFLAKLEEGYDLVSGWKFPRLDPFSKTFPSKIFNGLVSFTTGVHLHDINNGFKDRKSTRLNSNHMSISYAVFCL